MGTMIEAMGTGTMEEEEKEFQAKGAEEEIKQESQEREQAEERLTVTMTPEFLFDFTLYHTFSKFSGFLVNILGMAIAFMGVFMRFTGRASGRDMVFYFIATVCFLAYTPLLLKFRAKKQVKDIEEYKYPNEYTFRKEGIHIGYGDKEKEFEWGVFERIIATPKTIGFYYGADEALIIPKEQFGDQFVPILTMAVQNCRPFTVRIR